MALFLASILAVAHSAPVGQGYNYQVPDNPLVLPKKKGTTIPNTKLITTTIEASPLVKNLPTSPPDVDADFSSTLVETIKPSTTKEGYDYSVPENPLNLPVGERTTTTTSTTITLTTDQDSKAQSVTEDEGYNYPVPDNPLTLPSRERNPTTLSTTFSIRTMSTIATDVVTDGLAESVTDSQPSNKPTTENPVSTPFTESSTLSTPLPTTTATTTESLGQGIPNNGKELEGYNYPVPENPLTLPQRPNVLFTSTGTTTLSTTTAATAKSLVVGANDATTEGYNYPVPENPLTLPPRKTSQKATTTTISTTSTTLSPVLSANDRIAQSDKITEGYSYPIPENPLTFPTKKTTDRPNFTSTTTTTAKIASSTTSSSTTDSTTTARTFTSTIVTTTTTTATKTESQVDAQSEITELSSVGYDYPVPENPLQLPSKNNEKLIQEEEKSSFDDSDVVIKEHGDLPPCSLLDYDIDQDLTMETELKVPTQVFQIPGVTCRTLPPCGEDQPNGQVPGVDCMYDYYDYEIEIETPTNANDPPPLTTSTTTEATIGIASSSTQPLKSCLEVLDIGIEIPSPGINCKEIHAGELLEAMNKMPEDMMILNDRAMPSTSDDVQQDFDEADYQDVSYDVSLPESSFGSRGTIKGRDFNLALALSKLTV